MLIMQIEDDAFTTIHPEGDSNDPRESFDCDPDLVVEVSGDWGAVPKKK